MGLVSLNLVTKNTPQKVALALFAGTTALKLRPQLTVDTFVQTKSPQTNFVDGFVYGNNAECENFVKNYDFAQYKKSGIPLKYSRKEFKNDIENITLKMTKENEGKLLEKFGLTKNQDIDGIAHLAPTNNSEENSIKKAIKRYYFENESLIEDSGAKDSMDLILKGLPEFFMTCGKVQHGSHNYSVDIHTLKVLQDSMNSKEYSTLSDEGKGVLKLAILMHDFGKKGEVVTPEHPLTSRKNAEEILKKFNLPNEMKGRILNTIENHHWFERYNRGFIDANGVKDIFKTPEDLTIAKIMAKADFENINETLHRELLYFGVSLTQEEFDEEFAKKMDEIKY